MITGDERSTTDRQRLAVHARSGGRCEASLMVRLGTWTWTRCLAAPVECHHMLTRARGGDLLDEAGLIDHLIDLCRRHHTDAHGPGGRDAGFLIDGYVVRDSATGRLIYSGPDHHLSERFPDPRTQQWP